MNTMRARSDSVQSRIPQAQMENLSSVLNAKPRLTIIASVWQPPEAVRKGRSAMGTKPAVLSARGLVMALHAWRNNPSSDPGEQSVTLASR
jgi:hypothetical protein